MENTKAKKRENFSYRIDKIVDMNLFLLFHALFCEEIVCHF